MKLRDIHFSFLFLSSGLDLAMGMTAGSFSLGVDIDRLGKTLGYLPAGVSSPPSGNLPDPFKFEDDWMPVHLQENSEDAFQDIGPSLDSVADGVIQLPKVWEIPNRVEKVIESEKKELLDDLEYEKNSLKR